MKWYFIVLIFIGYIIVGSAFAGLAHRIDDLDDDDLDLFIIFFWPIAVPFFIVAGICMFVYELFRG